MSERPTKTGANPIIARRKGSVLAISTLPSFNLLFSFFGISSIFPTGTNRIAAAKRWDNSWIITPGKKITEIIFIDKNLERVLLTALESKNKITTSIKSKKI